MTIITHSKKTLVVDVTVKTNEVAKDITGGVARAMVVSPSGGKKTLPSAITNATGGVVQLTFGIGLIDIPGPWFAGLAVKTSTEDRTVWQEEILAIETFTCPPATSSTWR